MVVSEEKSECRYELSAYQEIRRKNDGNVASVCYSGRIDYPTGLQFTGRPHCRHSSPQQMILLCKYDRRRLTTDRRKTFSSLVVRRQARDDSF
jgi:hypothetical protein